MYEFESAVRSDKYILRDGGYEYSYSGVSDDEFSKFKLWLQSSFYVEYDIANWDGNSFATFTKVSFFVYASNKTGLNTNIFYLFSQPRAFSNHGF